MTNLNRFSRTAPDDHPPTLPPCRWPAPITLLTPTTFQLVGRHLRYAFFARAAPWSARSVLHEDRITRKYYAYSYMLDHTYSSPSYCRPDLYRFEVRMELYDGPALPSILFLCLRLTPRRHPQADGQLSLLYLPHVKFHLAWVKLCGTSLPLLVRKTRLYSLV